ncbi:hypothetical protein FS842_008863 [Serendipita sp. 407]|nr:hypothetical protein FS842_008863 [Serendipita sp. 407]
MSAVVPIRIAQATETTPKVHYRLLELSPDLCKLIETPSTQLVLTIKGKEGDDAVLCTANKTYALRSVNISNSLMIVNGPKSNEALANDGIFINDEIHEVMETVPMVPKLDRLYGVLRGSEYGEDEEDRMDEDDLGPDHSANLHQVIQASDEEFDHAIKTNHILELNGKESSTILTSTENQAGFLRPLPPKHLNNILIKIFNSIVAHGLPRSGIPIKDLEEALESDYEIPRSVSRQVIEWYGGVEGDKWVMNENKALRQAGLGLLRPYAHTPIKSEQFLSIWRDAVGDVFADQVELPLLRGNYLLHPGSSVRDEHMVTFFNRAELSTDPLTRFNELFLTRQKWLEGDIIAFIEDLGVDKKDCDRLLLKFARRSADRGGSVYYTSRSGHM